MNELVERCLQLNNPNLVADEDDVLYHFGLSKHSADLPALFGDVKVSVSLSPTVGSNVKFVSLF